MRAVAATIILLVSATASASSFGDGPGWWMFQVEAPTELDVHVRVVGATESAFLIRAWDADGHPLDPFAGYTTSRTGVYVEALGRDVDVTIRPTDPTTYNLYYGLDPGRYQIALVATGTFESWSVDLTAPGGMEPVGSGEHVLYADRSDFEEGVALEARAFIPAVGFGQDRVLSMDVAGTLVGTFGHSIGAPGLSLGPTETMIAHTPAGLVQCPCSFSDLMGPNSFGPGTYTFEWSGPGVGDPSMRPILAVADIDL